MDLKRLVTLAGFGGLLGLTWWLGHQALDQATHRVAATPLRLVEISEQAAIHFTHRPFEVDPKLAHIGPQVAATGAGVSLVDVDGDGWLDLYATTSRGGESNAFYRNLGNGRFLDLAEEAGLARLNTRGHSACMGSIWGDVDGDGDPDAFVYAYGVSHLMLQEQPLRFVDRASEAGLDGWLNANAATWIDYDRDGDLDLYVGGYFRDDDNLWQVADTRVMHDSFEFATDGGSNHLWRNQENPRATGGASPQFPEPTADGQGQPATAAGASRSGEQAPGDRSHPDSGSPRAAGRTPPRFLDVTAETGCTNTRWTYSVASADFDDDGFPDLYLANDYGPEELLLNRNGASFELLQDAGLEEDSKSGMSIAVGDVENQGRTATYVTNISETGFLFQGNNLRLDHLSDGGPLIEVARDQVADCGWAWGAQFADLDNDGWQDLFVTNGFVSDDPERDYWYDMAKIGGALGEVIEDAARWPAMRGRSLSGYERSRVLLNLEGHRFRDVAEQAGVTDRHDGRAVAVGDLFHDGALDVVVANQRGPLLLYSNAPIEGRHWIELELVGTLSPIEAYGATVKVWFGPHVQRLCVLSSVGFSAQNDRILHVGLGDSARVDRVSIRWPSGVEQELADLPADRLQRIVEPTE